MADKDEVVRGSQADADRLTDPDEPNPGIVYPHPDNAAEHEKNDTPGHPDRVLAPHVPSNDEILAMINDSRKPAEVQADAAAKDRVADPVQATNADVKSTNVGADRSARTAAKDTPGEKR